MTLSMGEQVIVTRLAKLLYDFLPASGNNSTSFPLAAAQAGIAEGWPGQLGMSKTPGIVHLLTWSLERRRDRFCSLIEIIVKQSLTWRSRKNTPLLREEVEELNKLLGHLQFKIPGLCDRAFLDTLPAGDVSTSNASPASDTTPRPVVSQTKCNDLANKLIALLSLEPHPRGFAFEKFLSELFAAYGLAPRGSFRLQGEQLDGSFVLGHETYLLEAKWHNAPTGVADLHAFAGKVRNRATWTRGLFISHAGFSADGLAAFGRSQPVVCMEGLDIYETLQRGLGIDQVMAAKVRRAAETGQPFTRLRDLF